MGFPNSEYVIVEDVEAPAAFDAAVKGVDGVLHTASPFHFNITNDAYVDLINPAVNGTLNLLKSALLETKIQRVVITSSYGMFFLIWFHLYHISKFTREK